MSAAAGGAPPSGAARAALLSEFCQLTNLGSPTAAPHHAEFAASFLEGNDWQLDAAVNAYLEMKADAAAAEGGEGRARVDDDAATAAALAAADAAAIAAASGEEQVRAPLPDRHERLFDEAPEELARRAYLHEQLMRGRLPPELAFEDAALGRGSRRGVPRGQVLPGPGIPPPAHSVASIDPFRNFAAEAGWRPAAAASSGSTRKSATSGAAANLGKLFAPPEELLCRDPATGGPAGMDVAVSEALRQRKWLLINVQQADEFASHQLNRDVWRNKAIAALVRDHFVFCQLSLATAEGARYRSLYRPPGVPSVALIDPETKQKIWDCHADALQDVDMADAAPTLIDSARKGELVVSKAFIKRLQRVLTEWAARTDLQMDGAAMPAGAAGHSARSAAESEEERMLQAAINASLGAASGSAPVSSISASASRNMPATSSCPRPVASSPAGAIVLDDDDDDDGFGAAGSLASSKDEEYVPITDSDGELDARIAKPRSRSSSMDSEEVTVGRISAPAARQAATTAAAAAAGDKRKWPLEGIDEEEHSAPSKVARSSEATVPAASSAAASASATASAAIAPPAAVPPEPAPGPDVCRLQIRLPAGAGKPLQRRFLRSDPIKLVLAFAREQMPLGMRQNKLQLVSVHPRRELTDEELSIEAHGVVNSSVIVEMA